MSNRQQCHVREYSPSIRYNIYVVMRSMNADALSSVGLFLLNFLALCSALYLLLCSKTCFLFLRNHLFLNSLALGIIEAFSSSADPRTVGPVLVVRSEETVPPPERRGEVIHKGHMVKVMVLSS